ncbi:hypothetical protein, partial [Enterobacter chengduensis]|uniref:hypothetical protein n=1 Tax=Enterobacter chengduensis TaxID=2494701 RepID=UPI001C945427
PSAKGDDKFITTDYLQQCPRRPSVPHRTAGCGKSSLRPLMAGSSPSLPDGSNPSAAIVQSASDVQCSRLLKTTNSQKGCYRRFDLQPIG